MVGCGRVRLPVVVAVVSLAWEGSSWSGGERELDPPEAERFFGGLKWVGEVPWLVEGLGPAVSVVEGRGSPKTGVHDAGDEGVKYGQKTDSPICGHTSMKILLPVRSAKSSMEGIR